MDAIFRTPFMAESFTETLILDENTVLESETSFRNKLGTR